MWRALRNSTGVSTPARRSAVDQAQAVEARQHDVDDGGVVRPARREIEPVHAVVGDVHGVAFLPQARGDELGDAAIVFDDEDAHASVLERHDGPGY